MRLAIRHLIEYRYASPVTDNLNALRVKPATTATQRVDDFGVRVDPMTRLHQRLDYFGTTVTELGIVEPHEHLSIDVRARVTTHDPEPPPEASWAALDEAGYRGAAGEFLLSEDSDPGVPAIDELVELSRAQTPLATVRRVAEVVGDRFEYRAGVTYVGSSVADLLEAGAGVCQDFAHLALVLLRRHGIAGRYVSGYLFAPPGGDASADSADVDTHAWVEALMPAEGEPVWVAADPTNRSPAGERHVKIGHGRRYADVPPIRGVFRGAAGGELSASVRMTRTDATRARA